MRGPNRGPSRVRPSASSTASSRCGSSRGVSSVSTAAAPFRKRGCSMEAHRIGLAQRGDGDDLDPSCLLLQALERARDRLRPVAEIGADADVCPHAAILAWLRLAVVIALAVMGPASAAGAPPLHAVDDLVHERSVASARAVQALSGRPFSLVEVTGGRRAEVALALAGGKPVSRRFGIWRLADAGGPANRSRLACSRPRPCRGAGPPGPRPESRDVG